MSDLEMKALVKFGEEYKQYATVNGQANPSATTHQQMQHLFGNWSDMLERMVANMWQPNTAYELNQVVWTPRMSANMVAICTNAGSSGAAEPTWPTLVNNTVTDGAAVWSMVAQVITGESPLGINQGGTGATTASQACANLGAVQTVNDTPPDENGNVNAGIPVGFEYFSINPNVPAGSIPLLGGEYSRTTYKDLWAWVQTQAGYLLTEEEWQAKASANDGNVPYYSSGDGSTTFRVPSLKSTTVQPKSIVGMWLVKAYGTVSNVGSTDVSAIAQGLTEAETRIGQLENHGAGATVVESYRNGTEWYRVWSDGWLEQGGYLSTSGSTTFLKPFNNTNYNITIGKGYFNDGDSSVINVRSKTKTSFTYVRGWSGGSGTENLQYSMFYACGMGA